VTEAAKSRRGRETALDMIRTLAVVFALVIPLWYFGQASPEDSKAIRPVDPTSLLSSYRSATGLPVPAAPAGWTVNVARAEEGTVRVGFVRDESYAEFTAGTGEAFLETYAGKGATDETLDVGGVRWDVWTAEGGQESLVRKVGVQYQLVGGVRETASREELLSLAATVR
jgi:hypothetical protein